ncbi:cysteine protease ATG4C [Trichinella spiralis]|uniref:cysteine protease ATG4C n=1 Tax=Trichinella spiralis TaxID=6334 RepID=UPI0001EFD8F0|nr:cysteine protease ATG4C [Trichinella spiralis]
MESRSARPELVDETRSWSRGVFGVVAVETWRGKKFNQLYSDHLKRVLSTKFCVGVIGGRHHQIVFIVKYPKKTLIADIDPWCSIGFYIRNRLELQSFLADISEAAAYGCSSPKHPLFTILSSRNEKHRTPIRMSTSYLASNSTKNHRHCNHWAGQSGNACISVENFDCLSYWRCFVPN